MCQTELGGDLEARSSETILQVLKETSRNGKEPHAAFGLSIYAPMSLIVHNGTPVLKETSRNGKEPHAAFGLSIYAPMSLIVHNGTPVDLHQLSTAVTTTI
ncbi:unnamed protein product [Ilex paraguariensis]|uniref:Uncharacterized protein n=1 Tax=Ilex paraguariensis TaxID=185542 RepID=A0ABC8UYR6_9AQUA